MDWIVIVLNLYFNVSANNRGSTAGLVGITKKKRRVKDAAASFTHAYYTSMPEPTQTDNEMHN